MAVAHATFTAQVSTLHSAPISLNVLPGLSLHSLSSFIALDRLWTGQQKQFKCSSPACRWSWDWSSRRSAAAHASGDTAAGMPPLFIAPVAFITPPFAFALQLAALACLAVLCGGAAAASCSTEQLPNAVPVSDAPFTLEYQRSATLDQTTFYFKVGRSRAQAGMQTISRPAAVCGHGRTCRCGSQAAFARTPPRCRRSAPRTARRRSPPSASAWRTACWLPPQRISSWPTRLAPSAPCALRAPAGGSRAPSWARSLRTPRWVLRVRWQSPPEPAGP